MITEEILEDKAFEKTKELDDDFTSTLFLQAIEGVTIGSTLKI